MLDPVSSPRHLFALHLPPSDWYFTFRFPVLPIVHLSPYHYVPTRYVAIIFVTLFALSTCRHCHLSVRAYLLTSWIFSRSSNTFVSGGEVSDVVAPSHCLFMWLARNTGMVSASVVKFFSIFGDSISNSVSICVIPERVLASLYGLGTE